MIEGESGVGKTRLAQEVLRRLRERDAIVHAVHAHAGEQGLAYGVLASLLRAAIGERPEAARARAARRRGAVAARAGRRRPRRGSMSPGRGCASSRRSRRCSPRALARQRRRSIDDLQWCDPASLDALAYLARRLEGRPLLAARSPAHRRARSGAAGRRRWPRSASGLPSARLTRADVVSLASRAGLDRAGRRARLCARARACRCSWPSCSPAPAADATRRRSAHSSSARLDAVEQIATQVLGAAAMIGRTLRRRGAAGSQRPLRGGGRRRARGADDPWPRHRARGALRLRPRAGARARPRSASASRAGVCCTGGSRTRCVRAGPTTRWSRATSSSPARMVRRPPHTRRPAMRARALSAPAEAIAHYEAALALGYPRPAALHEAIGDVHTLRGEYGAALAAYNCRRGADRAGRLRAPRAQARRRPRTSR